MGIVSISEIDGARSAGRDQRGNKTYGRGFRVVTDHPRTGPKAVRDAVPVAIGDYYRNGSDAEVGQSWYEEDDKIYCLEVAVKPEGAADAKQWIVELKYGVADPASFGAIDDPTQLPPKISWSGVRRDEVVDVDEDDKPVVNSAGDPFDPPITRDASSPTMVVTRNERTYDDGIAVQYRQSVNEAEFFGHAPGTVKCADIRAESADSPSIGRYYVVTYEFELVDGSWQPEVLDLGLRQRNTTSGAREQIVIDGTPATSPVLLDGQGQPLAADAVTGGAYFLLSFKTYKTRDFASLGLEG
jgi:hypothetical protein